MVTIRPVRTNDRDAWLRMRLALWPDGSEKEHRGEIEDYFNGVFPREPWSVLLAESEVGEIVGLIELSTRPIAEGCRSNRIAYVEGWYVVPGFRRQGVGRSLIAAAEEWGRSQGREELASARIRAMKLVLRPIRGSDL